MKKSFSIQDCLWAALAFIVILGKKFTRTKNRVRGAISLSLLSLSLHRIKKPLFSRNSLGAARTRATRLFKRPFLTQNHILAVIVILTGLVLAAGAFVLWPAYTSPESRFYTSAIGFLKVQRLLGIEMQAEAQHPVLHDFMTPVLGDGTLQCDFYNVPLVPSAQVTALHTEEGDQVKAGALLADLDDTEAVLNLQSAQLALDSANAQRARVEAGSVNTLVAERPDRDQVALDGLEKVLKVAQARVKVYSTLQGSGASSRIELINAQTELASAQLNYSQAQVDMRASSAGFPQSKEIAQNTVNTAQNLLKQRRKSLNIITSSPRPPAPSTGC